MANNINASEDIGTGVTFHGVIDAIVRGIAHGDSWFLFIFASIYAMFFVGLAIYAYYKVPSDIIRLLIYIACSGGLGGIVSNFIELDKDDQGHYHTDHLIWFYSRPVISPILGEIAFFSVFGGLLSVEGATIDLSKAFIITTIMTNCIISFLAGFSSRIFIEKLNEMARKIFFKENQ